jgi:hypothetical protein
LLQTAAFNSQANSDETGKLMRKQNRSAAEDDSEFEELL